ncbi:MAG: peptidoglycan editing factor PgeF [Epsilonproteobacteria bacterium]|nr:peptidoglycan editing factor PgeF [Campylobacterota bacterium]
MIDIKLFNPYIDYVGYDLTNRYGGVSHIPYDSLNLALHVGDDLQKVLENRTLLAKRSDFLLENLIYMDQVHGARIEVIDHCALNKINNCDALVTNQKNIPLMVMVADCIPILLYDPVKNVIGVAHAGRNGTFQEIAKKTVGCMIEQFDVSASKLLVYLGPSIHQCCYEIGSEIAAIVTDNFGEQYLRHNNESWYLDLQRMNIDQLLTVGVKEINIESSVVCSCCDTDYFSYRREGVTGRFAGIMRLK